MVKIESESYNLIKEKIKELLKKRIPKEKIYLEITYIKGLSEKLKKSIPKEKNIIFLFLGKKPDITGFIKDQYRYKFIIVEVKKEEMNLRDIYQAKMYKELFTASYTFLVSLKPIPEKLKRLCMINPDILRSASDYNNFFVLAYFNRNMGEIIGWYEKNPFMVDMYWKWKF